MEPEPLPIFRDKDNSPPAASGPDLSVNLGPLHLQNPVTVASGTFGFGEDYADFFSPRLLGAITTKTITLQRRLGNPPPRVAETPSGMLNSIGLQNPGVEEFVGQVLPRIERLGPPVIVSVAGESGQEYVDLASRLAAQRSVAALELNLSCPNVPRGGLEFGVDPATVSQLVAAVRREWPRTLLVKLSPNVTDIVALAQAAANAGADGLALINTILGMVVDVERRRPILPRAVGGLSGPAIRPVAVRMVWEVHRRLPSIPLVGMGGIACAADALEFVLAGATAVAVGTANFTNPRAPVDVIEGLRAHLEACRESSIRDLIGAAHER